MSRAYNVIDADGHILEPFELWGQYTDPKYRDRAPRLVEDADGKRRLIIEERAAGDPQRGFGSIGGIGARQGAVKATELKYEEGRPGGFDPHKRIPDMDLDGIDAAFLYPSVGLFAGSVQDPDLSAALCRAYNRWLADYCKPYPDRLFAHRDAADAVGTARDRGDALCAQGARLQGRLPAAQSVQRKDDRPPRLRAVLGGGRGPRHSDRVP